MRLVGYIKKSILMHGNVNVKHVFDDRFQAESGWNSSKNLHETYQCRMYSRKLLMMGREDA